MMLLKDLDWHISIMELPGVGVHDYYYEGDTRLLVIQHVSFFIASGIAP